MQLTETGESRINGYLFVLERSLKTFLARDAVRDAVREIESHLRERILAADGSPDQHAALERILAELGPPLRVAQAYSAERTIDEAVATGRLVPMARAVSQLASTTMTGFFAALGLLIGYLTAFAFLAIAVLKPIFPDNVGVQVLSRLPGRPRRALSARARRRAPRRLRDHSGRARLRPRDFRRHAPRRAEISLVVAESLRFIAR